MTKEEAKSLYTVAEVVERYGFKVNRQGFIRCPFHDGDNSSSMKIYPRNFHCYACQAHGDIFDFVSMIEKTSFKDALATLGVNDTIEREAVVKKRFERLQKHREAEHRKEEERRAIKREEALANKYKKFFKQAKPLSDVWAYLYHELQALYIARALRSGWDDWEREDFERWLNWID